MLRGLPSPASYMQEQAFGPLSSPAQAQDLFDYLGLYLVVLRAYS